MNNNPQRLYYIDWLRVLSMLLLFFYHADMFFNYTDWHVKNAELNIISSIHTSFFIQWIMPLFFILSGAAIFYSFKFRSGPTFLWERVKRILVPFVIVGYFVTSPPQMYLDRLSHSRFEGSFWDFIPTYFQGVVGFTGNFNWFGFHLWYLIFLFVFSLILFPLFKQRKNQKPSILSRFSNWLEGPWRLMLLVIPLIVVNVFIDINGLGGLRRTGGWDLFSYLFLLMYGYLFFCNEKILEIISRIRSVSLILAIILSLTGLVIGFGIKPEISENTPILYLCLTFLNCFRVLLWMIAIIGFGEKHLNFNNRFLRYANEAVLPFYILHQLVLIVIGYWVVQWQVNALVKYIVIASLSFIVIMGFYDIIIKRFKVVRFLFGLRLK